MVLVLLPWVFLTVRETVYLPFLVYVCKGFLTVEDVPSPKLHIHEVGDPVLLSVNCTLNGLFLKLETPRTHRLEFSGELRRLYILI